MVILVNHPPPTEGLHHVEQNVTAFYKNNNLGKGTLYISESVVSWVCPTGEGFSLPYVSIFIHAVCKDLSHFPHECIYMNVDGNLNIGEEEQQSEISGALSNLSVDDQATGDHDADEDIEPVTEMRFVPDNKEMLDAIFQAISDCQVLNPDPEQNPEEDYLDGEMIPAAFNFQFAANGTLEELEAADEAEGEEEEEEMAEEQFEDADDNM